MFESASCIGAMHNHAIVELSFSFRHISLNFKYIIFFSFPYHYYFKLQHIDLVLRQFLPYSKVTQSYTYLTFFF